MVEWNAVLAIVVVEIGAEPAFAEVAEAARPVSVMRERVGHPPQRRLVIARALPAAIPPDQPVSFAVFDAGASSALKVVCGAESGDVAAQPRMRRLVSGDGVDHSADGAAAVEQRGRAFDHFDPVHAEQIDWLGVIARLEA